MTRKANASIYNKTTSVRDGLIIYSLLTQRLK